MDRDKKTLAELEEARRLFEEIGLGAEAERARLAQRQLESAAPSREFATLYQIGQAINQIHEIEPLLDRIVDLAIQTLDAERGLIILIDEKTGEHRVATARNVERETTHDVLRYSESVVQAASGGEAILSSNTLDDARYRQFKSVALYDIKSFMCVPMRVRDRVIGTVYVDSRRAASRFDEDDLRFLEAFSNQASLAVENARLMRELREENRLLKETVSRTYGFDRLVGRSAVMERLCKTLAKVSDGTAPILILGESGTGKELIAKSIHVASARKDGPFVALNCAAIPRELLESELFGHVKGAFSGADRDKKGLLEMADGGTFFFDEIAEMDPMLQAKLLRAVEEGAIRRVGDTRLRPLNLRIVSATNRNIKEEVAAGRFREDLYYRLNVVQVRVPALRERREDVVLLAEHFLRHSLERSGKRLEGFSRDSIDALSRYGWPGNVRELENAVERAVAFAEGSRIELDDLPEELVESASAERALPEGASSDARAELLWRAVVSEGKGFWDVVREPFLRRELSREDLRKLVERGLGETRGSYKKLAERLGVGDQYKKFHAFLKNSGCHVARERFAEPGEDE